MAICYTDIKKKNKKNYLENKIIYAGVEDANTFENNLHSLLEDKLNITSIKDKLLIGDGDRWIKEINNLLEYLNNTEGIYGSKDLEINKVGSGAVEKNIEIMIGRKQNKEDWDNFFEELKWN